MLLLGGIAAILMLGGCGAALMPQITSEKEPLVGDAARPNLDRKSGKSASPDKGTPAHPASDPLVSEPQSYPIGPTDILQIQIYAGGEKHEDFSAEVSPTGMITSPLIGDIQVTGSTSFELAARMTKLLGRDFFINPQVLVAVKEHGRKVFVMGEVKKPGAYSLDPGLTALNLCILAGGFGEYAAPARAHVTRFENGATRTIAINLLRIQQGKDQDLVLQSGDRIDIPQRLF